MSMFDDFLKDPINFKKVGEALTPSTGPHGDNCKCGTDVAYRVMVKILSARPMIGVPYVQGEPMAKMLVDTLMVVFRNLQLMLTKDHGLTEDQLEVLLTKCLIANEEL